VRNTYSLFDYGDWVKESSNDRQDPYIQLLSVTNKTQAHQEFVQVRLNGVDTTNSTSQQLLPADQGQKSPISEAEKHKM
jgi:P pilus assembly chaperone PapD